MIFSIFIRSVLDNVSGKRPRRYQEQLEFPNQLGTRTRRGNRSFAVALSEIGANRMILSVLEKITANPIIDF